MSVLLTAIIALLLLAGCGQGDPVVGTWNSGAGAPSDFVIATSSDGYRCTLVLGPYERDEGQLSRQGNKLIGTIQVEAGGIDETRC
jgi:hypothetical protein